MSKERYQHATQFLDSIKQDAAALVPFLGDFDLLYVQLRSKHIKISNKIYEESNDGLVYINEFDSLLVIRDALEHLNLSHLLENYGAETIHRIKAVFKIARGEDPYDVLLDVFSGTTREKELCEPILTYKKKNTRYVEADFFHSDFIKFNKLLNEIIKVNKKIILCLKKINISDIKYSKNIFEPICKFNFAKNKSSLAILKKDFPVASEIIYLQSAMGRENIKRFEKFLENYSRQGKLSCLFDLVEYLDGVELKYSNTELFWFAVDLSRLLNIFKKLNFKSELRGGKNTLKLSLKW